MVHLDKTVLMSSDQWKVAEALITIDCSLLSICDDYSETVEYLCEMADMTFDHDLIYEKEDYVFETAKIAYSTILLHDAYKIISSNSEYYYESMEQLRLQLCWGKSRLHHPIVDAMEVLVDYVKPLGDMESLGRLEEVFDYLKSTNLDVAILGKEIAYEFFRYLDEKYYLQSNDAFTVGGLTSKGHPEYSLGEYVIHATIRSKSDEGYTVVFNKFDYGIVASFYEFKRYTKPTISYSHKDLNYSITITSTNEFYAAQEIASKINELTKQKMEKAS